MSKDNVRVSIIFIITNMCTAFYYTYLAQLLSSFGFSAQQIGTLLMVYVLLAVVSMPLMGYISDNFLCGKYLLLINAVISILSSIAFWNVEPTFFNMMIVISVWSFNFKPIVNLVESYTYKLINEGDDIDYGIVRSTGSLGFAIGAYVMGVIIDETSFRSLYYMQLIGMVFFIISVIVFFRTLPVKKPSIAEDVTNNDDLTEQSEQNVGMKSFLTNRDYLALIIGGFFINISVSLHFTYVPLLLEENGASASSIGIAFSLMALVEIPIIATISKILKRVKPSTLLVTGGVVYIIRMIAVMLNPTVYMFIGMGLLQCFSFAFLSTTYIYIMNIIVPKEVSSTAILLGFSVIFNLSAVFSMYFGGYFIDIYGYQKVLSYGWIFCLIGTLIFFLNFKVFKNKDSEYEL